MTLGIKHFLKFPRLEIASNLAMRNPTKIRETNMFFTNIICPNAVCLESILLALSPEGLPKMISVVREFHRKCGFLVICCGLWFLLFNKGIVEVLSNVTQGPKHFCCGSDLVKKLIKHWNVSFNQ